MIKCNQATRLMSERLDRILTRGERFSLRLHLAMCINCRRCGHQLTLLHEAGKRYPLRQDDID